MNSLSFQTSSPSGKLFSGWYRPLFIASSLAASDGHAYETSFQWNLSSNFAEKPFRMHTANNNISKNFIYFIFFFSNQTNYWTTMNLVWKCNFKPIRYFNWISSATVSVIELKQIKPTDHRNDQFLSDANYVVTNYWGHYIFWITFACTHHSRVVGVQTHTHFSIMFWLVMMLFVYNKWTMALEWNFTLKPCWQFKYSTLS